MKDGAKDYPLPPVVLFLQCQIYIAEGLTMVTSICFSPVFPWDCEREIETGGGKDLYSLRLFD